LTAVRVLFICSGNICRSPTAEGVLRKLIEEAGLAERIEVDSAGIGDWHVGDPADPRTVQAAARRGYDLTPLRARQLQRMDYEDFDLLVAMDRGHYEHLSQRRPDGGTGRIHLLLDFAPEAAPAGGPDVPDPYYGGTADFEHALNLIERGAAGLLAALRRDFL
jgi:protein-tyrosine phosphatase